MKVGDLVDVNQTRGAGSYKHTIARGLGVIVSFQETEDLVYPKIGSFNLGPIVHVLLSTGQMEGFTPKSLRVIND